MPQTGALIGMQSYRTYHKLRYVEFPIFPSSTVGWLHSPSKKKSGEFAKWRRSASNRWAQEGIRSSANGNPWSDRLDDHNINTTTSKSMVDMPWSWSGSFSRNLYWENISKNRAEEMNEAGYVQNHWVETLWNCCPHVYHTPLYPAINMKMTRKWPIEHIHNDIQPSNKAQTTTPTTTSCEHELLVTRIRCRLAHVYRGALILIATLWVIKKQMKWIMITNK